MSTLCERRPAPVAPVPAGRRLRVTAGLREVSLLTALWLVYSAGRTLAGHDQAAARHRALGILDLERTTGLDVEAWLNHAVAPVAQLAVPMSFWYAALHYLVTPAVLVLLFVRHPTDYPRARTALVVATAIGLAAYLLVPTAPPRLMPGGRYVDVLARTSYDGWWSDHASAPAGLGHLTNELAAMPSLHVGWTVWVAWALWPHVGTVGRTLSGLYVLATTVVVLATGNHWVLDAVAGAAVVAVGIAVTDPRPRRAPGASRQPDPVSVSRGAP